jgi:hypothetical protein
MGLKFGDVGVGDKIVFGRGILPGRRGEITLGEISGFVRGNNTKAKVTILEDRGSRSKAGQIWTVPYSMMRKAHPNEIAAVQVRNGGKAEVPTDVLTPVTEPVVKLEYNMFQPAEEVHILMAILACYSGLSPENLPADGEAPRAFVQRQGAKLRRMLRGLFQAFGREVGELEVYDWYHAKEADERQRAAQRASA